MAYYTDMEQILYLVILIIYFLVLFLFIRLQIYGWWSEKTYWRKKPKLSIKNLQKLYQGQKLPRLTIFVPAYNESEVIDNTIEHLFKLVYPTDRLEIIVVTDEKELETNSGLTTQEVVENKIGKLIEKKNLPNLRHLIVPKNFDGYLHGKCLDKIVPSTKGRALNFAIPHRHQQTKICAFYDCDSRPNKKVLLYIAYRYLKNKDQVRLWQGPVYQVRNFFQLYHINKVAALYQSISHQWYLPVLMSKLPFAGGTNLFITSGLIDKINGFDHNSLTEDLELGIRVYVETGNWPEYIPYPSTEQTPSTYRAFFRQRLRWGSGYLQVMEKLQQANMKTVNKEKRRKEMLNVLFWNGPVEWIFFQTIILFPLFILLLNFFFLIAPQPLFTGMAGVMNIMVLFISIAFTFERLYHFSSFINFDLASPNHFRRILSVLHLLLLPIAGFFFVIPFTTSIILKTLRRQPLLWVKTPRTKEVISK